MNTYDVAIIGSGPGGYAAAVRAAGLGAKVCVIEKENLGGVCLNKGCIPTKTLLKSANIVSQIKQAADFGVDVDACRINFPRMLLRKKEIVERLQKGIELLFKARKIEWIKGQAKIISPCEIEITNSPVTRIETKNIIVAVGSRPLELAGFEFDREKILSSSDILNISRIPQSLLVVGGGVIGCEFAVLFNKLGAKVTVLEMAGQILPGFEKEIAKRLQGILKKQGIEILTGTKAEISDAEKAEKVLVCVGRRPNTAGLGLEDIGIELEKGCIIVNEYLRTRLANVFAIGDCIGGHLLAHAASYEGKIAAENISGNKKKVDYLVVPSCVFTSPEVSAVGLTQDQAEEKGLAVKVGKFSFRALAKAQLSGETEGLVKIVVDQSNGEILGAQLLGAEASELIAELALAIKLNAKAGDLADTIHAHPTIAEAIMEAADSLR